MTEDHPREKTAPQYISYTLSSDEYALQISQISEINKVTAITRIPQSPDFVAGVVNLRGGIVPIIDMRIRLGYPRAKPTKNSRTVICNIHGQTVGLLVDEVYHVLSIPDKNLIPPPEMFNSVDVRFIDAMTRIGDRLILIVNLEKLIDQGEIAGVPKSAGHVLTEPEV